MGAVKGICAVVAIATLPWPILKRINHNRFRDYHPARYCMLITSHRLPMASHRVQGIHSPHAKGTAPSPRDSSTACQGYRTESKGLISPHAKGIAPSAKGLILV